MSSPACDDAADDGALLREGMAAVTARAAAACGLAAGLFAVLPRVPPLAAERSPGSYVPLAYAADRCGVDRVAVGSDFDGATMPMGVPDAAALPAVLDAPSQAGFTEPDLDRIASTNRRRVLAAAWS